VSLSTLAGHDGQVDRIQSGAARNDDAGTLPVAFDERQQKTIPLEKSRPVSGNFVGSDVDSGDWHCFRVSRRSRQGKIVHPSRLFHFLLNSPRVT
jgi:hypothetical protein